MKWKNAETDHSPSDKQEVLIAMEGIYYSATYHAMEKGFEIHEIKKFIRLEEKFKHLYWVEKEEV